MSDLLHTSYDHKSGLLVKSSTEESTGKMHVQTFQDIESNLEVAGHMRNDPAYTAKGIKQSFAHVATIPAVVVTELLGVGINVYTASAKDIVAGLRKLHKENLLTTTRKLWRG